jgi:hypothetical protein
MGRRCERSGHTPKRDSQRFCLKPERLGADTAGGAAPILHWLVEKGIAPHIPVNDKSKREDDTFSRRTLDVIRQTTSTTVPRAGPDEVRVSNKSKNGSVA